MGELKVLENSLDFFSLGPQGPLCRPAKPQFGRFASFVFLLSQVHSQAQCDCQSVKDAHRAAIFSSYGNETRLDRFIPVSTALLKKKKQLDGVHHACMHASTCVDRRVELRGSGIKKRGVATTHRCILRCLTQLGFEASKPHACVERSIKPREIPFS